LERTHVGIIVEKRAMPQSPSILSAFGQKATWFSPNLAFPDRLSAGGEDVPARFLRIILKKAAALLLTRRYIFV
jgi:hypothetical protein